MPKIKISISSLILIPIVLLDPSGGIAAAVIAAVLHELGHLTMIYLFKIGVKELRITPYGLIIQTSRRYRSFTEETAVNCAGCAVNFIIFLLFSRTSGFLHSLAYASAVLGTLNALPVLSLDGGETVRALLSELFPFRTAEKLSRGISFITLICMWVISVYIFLFSGYNYSLFVMSVWLFAKIYCKK